MLFKDVVYLNFKKIRTVTFGTIVCTLLLALRIKITGSFHYLFLGWNLILALIPMAIALLIYRSPYVLVKKWSRYVCSMVWLLFLPNAPYLLTDFIHLKYTTQELLPFDLLLIATFAATGFLAGFYSLKMMLTFYRIFYSKRVIKFITISICILTGFGVYLGRFVRLNSWDLFTQPWYTIGRITESLTHPMAWLTTIIFTTVMIAPILFHRPYQVNQKEREKQS